MIRRAKHVDIFRMVELVHEMHEASRYATIDEVDEKVAHRLLGQCVQRHGHTTPGGTFCMVAIRDMKVEGFVVGMLDNLYHIGKHLMAQDIFLYCSKKAKPGSFVELLRAYVEWASDNPRVKEIKLSWTDALDGADRIEGVYEKLGFRKCGGIFVKDNTELELAA